MSSDVRGRTAGPRRVSFPQDDHLVTQYFEPEDPWRHVSPTSHERLLSVYVEACKKHNTDPIESVLQNIRDLPESVLNGTVRAPRLSLTSCCLRGTAAVDALESLLCRVQFRRLELHDAQIDDVGAEAIFDMIEYYESATILNITGRRDFGVSGWQACSRMIRKSRELTELEVRDSQMDPQHTSVLERALKPHTCRLRSLCLTRAYLSGDSLTSLVAMLKINNSVRELKLGDNQLTKKDANQLAELIKYNTRLHLLDLSNNYIEDDGVELLSKGLVQQAAHTPPSPVSPHHCPATGYDNRGLAFLVLWNNQLTRNCAPHLARAVSASHSLCVLNVGRNALGDSTVHELSRSSGLVSLGLQAASLGHKAGKPIADLIRGHTTLQRLDLRDNKLGGAALQLILTALKDNTILTQIDLDDDAESSTTLSADSGGPERAETAERARLTRDIRAACRRNEPAPSEHRPHRKISLTCHSAACSLRSPPYEESRRAGRLRSPAPSPAPSPAGSPVPPQHSRFSVTKVTPDRETSSPSSSGSPSTPTKVYFPTSSRFKVVQVAEPPQLQTTRPDKSKRSSRFSVTRNYDSIYNPAPSVAKSDTSVPKCDSGNTNTIDNNCHPKSDAVDRRSDAESTCSGASDDCAAKSDKPKSDIKHDDDKNQAKYQDKSEEVSHSESLNKDGDDTVIVSETKLVKTSREVRESEKVDVKVEVTVKKETLDSDTNNSDNSASGTCVNSVNNTTAKVHTDQNNADDNAVRKTTSEVMDKIEAITEDLGNLIEKMGDISCKTHTILARRVEIDRVNLITDCTQTDEHTDEQTTHTIVPVNIVRDSVVLKKNKSESSLDSPDLEVSRLMEMKDGESAFRDSNSSFSEGSLDSLNNPEIQVVSQIVISEPTVQCYTELDRRKIEMPLSAGTSLDSNTSDATPVNSSYLLNTSVSSNESVSPIIFGKEAKHSSLSSLEASVSSLDSTKATHERAMMTSADSGIEYSLQHPSETHEDNSSNEGTLTHCEKEADSDTKKVNAECQAAHDTLTSLSPKRTSSLLDMPALKSKSLDRVRKISLVAQSPSFQMTKAEPEPPKESKLPSHLEKLLSLFQHPSTLFSRSASDDDRKVSGTPPRKESSGNLFWSWGAASTSAEKTEREDKVAFEDSSPENATDSTLSERVQVSYVDESFSRKLDSKTPSTDTDNTLSEFQSFPTQCASESSETSQETTDADRSETGPNAAVEPTNNKPTDNKIVQKQLDLRLKNTDSDTGESQTRPNCDIANDDLIDKYVNPNDFNKNLFDTHGTPAGDSHSCFIQAQLTAEPQNEAKSLEVRPRSFAAVLKSSSSNSIDKQCTPDSGQSIDKLPTKVIRGIKENISPENTVTTSISNANALAVELTESKSIGECNPIVNALWEVTTFDQSVLENCKIIHLDSYVRGPEQDVVHDDANAKCMEQVDLGSDALSLLAYESQDYETDVENSVSETESKCTERGNLADELRDAEIKEQMDLSPELVVDEAVEPPEVFAAMTSSPVAPERAKVKKSSSLEDLSQRLQRIDDDDGDARKSKIMFKMPELGSTPKDIPETRRHRLRTRSGSSPKSLPETFIKSPIGKLEPKRKKKVSSLGKIARDSLLALNMSEDEIAEFRRSYKLTSVESLRSLESVSEDAYSQSGNSVDSRCKFCFRTSQESLMSLDSISEDCRCGNNKCSEDNHSAG